MSLNGTAQQRHPFNITTLHRCCRLTDAHSALCYALCSQLLLGVMGSDRPSRCHPALTPSYMHTAAVNACAWVGVPHWADGQRQLLNQGRVLLVLGIASLSERSERWDMVQRALVLLLPAPEQRVLHEAGIASVQQLLDDLVEGGLQLYALSLCPQAVHGFVTAEVTLYVLRALACTASTCNAPNQLQQWQSRSALNQTGRLMSPARLL